MRNGIVVLGVLFRVSDVKNENLQNILDSVDDIANKVGSSAPLKKDLRANALLPLNPYSYFRYEGSLTTPSCAESVSWTVFSRIMSITFDQLEALKLMKSSNGTDLLHNYRQVQPLNSRSLIFVDNVDDEVEENYNMLYTNGANGAKRNIEVLSAVNLMVAVLIAFCVRI